MRTGYPRGVCEKGRINSTASLPAATYGGSPQAERSLPLTRFGGINTGRCNDDDNGGGDDADGGGGGGGCGGCCVGGGSGGSVVMTGTATCGRIVRCETGIIPENRARLRSCASTEHGVCGTARSPDDDDDDDGACALRWERDATTAVRCLDPADGKNAAAAAWPAAAGGSAPSSAPPYGRARHYRCRRRRRRHRRRRRRRRRSPAVRHNYRFFGLG